MERPLVERKRYYQEIFTEWKLGKGARDRYTTSYRQYTDVVNGSSGRRGKTGILDTFPRKGRVSEQ